MSLGKPHRNGGIEKEGEREREGGGEMAKPRGFDVERVISLAYGVLRLFLR